MLAELRANAKMIQAVAGRIAGLRRRLSAGGEEVLARIASIHLVPLERLTTSQQLGKRARTLGSYRDGISLIASFATESSTLSRASTGRLPTDQLSTFTSWDVGAICCADFLGAPRDR